MEKSLTPTELTLQCFAHSFLFMKNHAIFVAKLAYFGLCFAVITLGVGTKFCVNYQGDFKATMIFVLYLSPTLISIVGNIYWMLFFFGKSEILFGRKQVSVLRDSVANFSFNEIPELNLISQYDYEDLNANGIEACAMKDTEEIQSKSFCFGYLTAESFSHAIFGIIMLLAAVTALYTLALAMYYDGWCIGLTYFPWNYAYFSCLSLVVSVFQYLTLKIATQTKDMNFNDTNFMKLYFLYHKGSKLYGFAILWFLIVQTIVISVDIFSVILLPASAGKTIQVVLLRMLFEGMCIMSVMGMIANLNYQADLYYDAMCRMIAQGHPHVSQKTILIRISFSLYGGFTIKYSSFYRTALSLCVLIATAVGRWYFVE